MYKRNKTVTLGQLNDSDVFKYVVQAHIYRRGKFQRLQQDNCYIRDNATDTGILIVNLKTGRVCRHSKTLAVKLLWSNIKSESGENNMDNVKNKKYVKSMDHFIGWKFGVPVKVYVGGRKIQESLLFYEDAVRFKTVNTEGVATHWTKEFTCYELIPYAIGGLSPRYPLCTTLKATAYCNMNDVMERVNESFTIRRLPDHTATLEIDGKKIELSQDTIANLIKELGV